MEEKTLEYKLLNYIGKNLQEQTQGKIIANPDFHLYFGQKSMRRLAFDAFERHCVVDIIRGLGH